MDCSEEGPPSSSEEVAPVKVGIVTSLSGQLSSYCLPAADGIQFVIDEINENGGVKSLGGAKIELVRADDKGDPTLAPAEMERLMTQEKVVAVFEGPAGYLQQALAAIGDKNQVPQICVAAYDSSIPTQGFNFWYAVGQSIHPCNTNAYLKLFDSLVEEHGVKADRIAILTFEDPATQMVRQGLKAKVSAKGAKATPGFISGAQAMHVLYRALEDAGSRDPVAINQALKAVRISPGPDLITYTYLPEFAFNEDGTPVNAQLSGRSGRTARS